MKKKIKKYSKENVRIQIKEFELKDVSFFGCDACFDFEIRDKETDVLLATDYVTIENAFMGVVDSDDIYYFLEEKGIDFDKEYDGSFHNLPADLQKEYEEYDLDYYNEVYHEQFFDDDSTLDEFVDKIMQKLYLDDSRRYLIHGKDAAWINVILDGLWLYPHSDEVKIQPVYNVNSEDWIYEADGVYFSVEATWTDCYFDQYERDETCKYIVTEEDLDNDRFPGYDGKVGDVLYGYNLSIYDE